MEQIGEYALQFGIVGASAWLLTKVVAGGNSNCILVDGRTCAEAIALGAGTGAIVADFAHKYVGLCRGQGKFWLGKKFKDRFFMGKKYCCPVDNTKSPLGKVPSFWLESACASMIFHWLEIPLLCGQYKVAIGQSIFVPVGKRCSA